MGRYRFARARQCKWAEIHRRRVRDNKVVAYSESGAPSGPTASRNTAGRKTWNSQQTSRATGERKRDHVIKVRRNHKLAFIIERDLP